MKKLLLTISLFICANIMFAADITLRVGDVDVTGKVPGDKVYVPVYIDAITPGAQITGWQMFFGHNQAVLTWDGSNPDPTPGIHYLNPLFPNSAAAVYNVNASSELVYLWGDGTAVATPTGPYPLMVIEFTFTYHGGVAPGSPSPIVWGTSGKIAGDMMVKGTTEVYDGNYDYYVLTLVNGGLYLPSIGVHGLWTGNSSSDWNDAGNWDDGLIPSSGDDITIPVVPGKAVYPVIIGGPIVVGTLNIAPLAQLTLGCAPGGPCGELTTLGLFTNNGSFYMDTEAGNGYSSTFIPQGGLAGAGMFYYTRDMLCTGTTGNSTDPNWHYVAAPIDGFDTWDMFDYYVNAWDQPTGFWNQVEGIAPNCAGPGPQIPLAPMDAWSVNYATDYTCNVQYPGTGLDLEFMGPAAAVHSGPYAKPFGYGAAGYQMWNMIGNPYPSGLDMSLITWSPNMVQGAAYWDGCTPGGGYLYWTPALGAYSMSPGLGFFTEATAPGVFALAGTERAHGADWFWKSEVTNLVTLQATGNERSDLTHIRFMENASPAFETTGDFHKLFVDGSPMIYTTAGADMLAVNVLPETPVVPMDFTSTVSGSFTISAIETSDFANVVLEDRTNGVQTDLLTGSYTFNYTVGDNVNRFFVHFTPLGTPELAANSINIWAADHNIYVQAPATTGDIVVYNLMGQEVVRTDIEAGLNVIPMTDVNTYYIVKVIGSDITETGKVFIK
jgi:hypothetical protein